MLYNRNTTTVNPDALIMYVDMNSYFASCEQQLHPLLRGKPIGVCPFPGDRAVIIAPSKEAKPYGVKTGMRFCEAKLLCPELQMVGANPVAYRKFHIDIINTLRSFCDEVIPKSIDEAVMNLSSYRYIYKDPNALALRIKYQLAKKIGEHITCSIGIAPNVFLAKLATELHKPDGLVSITQENIDQRLAGLQLTDLPGIASRYALRLGALNINTPLEMRNSSEAMLRKAFGGVVGSYWYQRLHFGEVDLYTSSYKAMSAGRMVPKEVRGCLQAQHSLLISLCTKIEQRLVKKSVFCRGLTFCSNYYDGNAWKTAIKINDPLQDGMDMVQHIMAKVRQAEAINGFKAFAHNIKQMVVSVHDFVPDVALQYSLFDNRLQRDLVRKTMYQIKDKYGKNIVRKAAEIIQTGTMKDAIGFGSVKDLYQVGSSSEKMWDEGFNQFLLEEEP